MRGMRLYINIDHVATVRQARLTDEPDPVRAAMLAELAGVDGITVHLREDRRHITDDDIQRLVESLDVPLNLEMAAVETMRPIAVRHRPHAVCLVPERREELTTEGGLDVIAGAAHLGPFVEALAAAGSRVALFIDPDDEQIEAARQLGVAAVELHTGGYCEAEGEARARELERITGAARHAVALGLECHAGHGLSFDSVGPIAAILEIVELNIGHFLVGESVFEGLERSIKHMRALIDQARAGAIPVTRS